MNNGLFSLLVLCFGGGITFCQDQSELIQQRIEFISEHIQPENVDLSSLTELLHECLEHPMNLNTVEEGDLHSIFLLSDFQINALLLHRRLFGKFITVYELQSIDFWDQETIDRVLPFVHIDDKLNQLHLSVKEAINQGSYEATFRYQTILQEKKGYTQVSDSLQNSSNAYYHGNKDHYYSRFNYAYRSNLSAGITAEKDPGEAFFRGAQRNGFDFYSAHAFFQGGKYLKSFALGDYQVQIGQGLNFWTGYAFNKSSDVMSIKKTAQPLRPFKSSDESRFLRGTAVHLGFGPWSMLTFASIKRVDAALEIDSTNQDFYFATGTDQSGLHRTNAENSRRHSLKETIAGTSVRLQLNRIHFGVHAIYQGFDQPVLKDTLPYNQFDFRGDRVLTGSLDYSFMRKNAHFFGEFSINPISKATAQLHGLLLALHQRCSFSALFRSYERDYVSFYNAGFSESGNTQNESGLYLGLKYQPNRLLTLNAFLDVFSFPWLNYQVSSPTKGNEVLLQLSYRPSKTLEIYARYRQQLHQKNSRDLDGTVSFVENVQQANYRIHISYNASESITFRSRIEFVALKRLSNINEKGIVLLSDVLFKPKSWPFDLTLRYTLFDTDSYDSRLYAYENNVLNVFSIPALFNQGSRGYVLMRWTFLKNFDVWLRYGVSIYANKKTIGTGPEEITGAKKSDISIQLRLKF
jgi:hypothetical protein